jgi:D-glycero-alpha-D-manno-heptose 1-phosphate guanylyltransferase
VHTSKSAIFVAANLKAIVLAGGLGTRLKHLTTDTPKPMVDIAGRPFLEYLLDSLESQGVSNVVLAVSYLNEKIIGHFGSSYRGMELNYSVEETPLGTGGAIRQALDQHAALFDQELFVLNGDTFVDFNLEEMRVKKHQTEARFVMLTKHMDDTGRYGRIEVKGERVTTFQEKQSGSSGFINAGVYLFDVGLLDDFATGSAFSFEKDILEKYSSTICPVAFVTSGHFIDIGIPEDYQRAAEELPKHFLCHGQPE